MHNKKKEENACCENCHLWKHIKAFDKKGQKLGQCMNKQQVIDHDPEIKTKTNTYPYTGRGLITEASYCCKYWLSEDKVIIKFRVG